MVPVLSLPLTVNMLCKSDKEYVYDLEFFPFFYLYLQPLGVLVNPPILHLMPKQLKDSAVCVVSIDISRLSADGEQWLPCI